MRHAWAYLVSLAAVLGYAAFGYGGAAPLPRIFWVLALGVVTLAFWLQVSRKKLAPRRSRGLWGLGLLFPAYVAFQLIPLPRALLATLSPARAQLTEPLDALFSGLDFAPITVLPAVTFTHLLLIGVYAVVFLMVRQLAWQWPERPWVLAAPIIAVASLEAAVGLLQYIAGAPEARGTYGNRNHFVGLLELALPFAVMYPVAVLWRRGSRRRLPVLTALKAGSVLSLAALIFVAVSFSFSRMAFAASLGSVALMGLLVASRSVSTRWAPSVWKKAVAFALVVALAVLGFVFLPSDQLIERFAELSSTEEITAGGRLLLWGETLDLIGDYTLFGCGLGGYSSAFYKYKVTNPLKGDISAHNDYLQLLAELGVFGFLIGAVLVLPIFGRALRAGTRHPMWASRCLGIACVGSMAAISLHGTVDRNLYIPANVMLLAWIFGISAGLDFSVHRVSPGGASPDL